MDFRLAGALAASTLTLAPITCELIVAPTAITDGALAGEEMLRYVGKLGYWVPLYPSFPAATTTTIPALTAASYAVANGSQAAFPVNPQAAPVSSAPVKAGPTTERDAISMPSLRASLIARIRTLSVDPSNTPGDPETL